LAGTRARSITERVSEANDRRRRSWLPACLRWSRSLTSLTWRRISQLPPVRWTAPTRPCGWRTIFVEDLHRIREMVSRLNADKGLHDKSFW